MTPAKLATMNTATVAVYALTTASVVRRPGIAKDAGRTE